MMTSERARSPLFAFAVLILLTTASCGRVPPAQKEPLTQQRLLAALLETAAEVALIISLFAVGMQLGIPLGDRRWWLSGRLALLSMTAMVAMVAATGALVNTGCPPSRA